MTSLTFIIAVVVYSNFSSFFEFERILFFLGIVTYLKEQNSPKIIAVASPDLSDLRGRDFSPLFFSGREGDSKLI